RKHLTIRGRTRSWRLRTVAFMRLRQLGWSGFPGSILSRPVRVRQRRVPVLHQRSTLFGISSLVSMTARWLMHEAGLMQTALELAFDRAREAGASRIHQMTLRVGSLSGVVPEALRLAFRAATPGTVADGATLVVDEVAVRCRCEQCGEEFWPDDIVYL